MRNIAQKSLAIFTAITFMASSQSFAADPSWIGGFSNQLADGANWTGGVGPVGTELGLFDGSVAVTTTPTQSIVGGIGFQGFQFTGTPQTFLFTLDGTDTIQRVIVFGFTTTGGGVDNSILGASALQQTFQVINGGIIKFINQSSADINSTGKLTYNLLPPTGPIPAELLFDNSVAGKAIITADSGNGTGFSHVNITNDSDMQSATLTATNNGEIDVVDSTLGNSTVNLFQASMDFTGSGTPGNATITANNGFIFFNADAAVSTAKITLTNLSSMSITDDLTIGSLNTDPNSSFFFFFGPDLTVGDSSSMLIAGPLSGQGIFTKQGSGTAELTNTNNTMDGGVIVSAGTLKVSVANLPAAVQILSLNGTLLFNQNVDATFAGTILAGTGTLEKQGPATLTLGQDNIGFSGLTHVLAGQLILNKILGGSVTVDGSSILSGTGKILGNLHVNTGTVKPGNSIGTLTVGGNYLQSANGIYEAEINGSGQSDLIDIGGTATLSGTLAVISLDGVLDTTKLYTVLQAQGGVSGRYTQVTSNVVTIVPVVTYLPNSVIVTLTHLLTSVASNHNQQTVADELLSITNPTPQEQAVLNQLIALSASPATVNEARRALSQMSGEQYTNTILTTELASRSFLRRLYDPLRHILTASPECNCYDDIYQDGSYCYPFKQLPRDYNSYCDVAFWSEISGGRSFLRHDSNAGGFSMDTYDIGIGAQKDLSSDALVGLAASYQHDNLDYNVGGTGKNNIGLLAAYALYHPQEFYFMGDLVLGFNFSKVTRTINIGDLHFKAHGKPMAFEGMLYVEGGKSFNFDWLSVQPFAGLELDCFFTNKFNESGASPLNLSVHNESRTAAFSRLGLHMTANDVCHFFHFDLDLAWQCRLSSLSNHVKERFTDFGDNFTVFGVSTPRNSLEATANVGIKLGDCCSAFLELSGQRWERLSSYSVVAGFLTSW